MVQNFLWRANVLTSINQLCLRTFQGNMKRFRVQITAHEPFCHDTFQKVLATVHRQGYGSLLGMRQIHIREILWRMTSCNYPPWKHSQRALAPFTVLVVPDVFILY
jgi:hypothetical protein